MMLAVSVLNKQLRVLLFTDSLVLISAAMLAPFYALYVDKIGGDILDAGMAASAFAVAAGVASILSGKLADLVRHKERIVALSYLVTGVSFVAYIFVESMAQLLLVQVVIGLAQALYAPAYDALYSKHIRSKRRAGAAWAAWESLNYFALAIGTGAGALLIEYMGFKALFVAMASLCIISSLRLYILPRRFL